MRWLSGSLAIAVIVFAIWHGPGLLTALRAVSPPPARNGSAAVEQLNIPLRIKSSPLDSDVIIEVRAFVSADWRGRKGAEKLPLVLYMPGWGGRATDSDVLLRRIAEEGYLAIAVDDVAVGSVRLGESDEIRSARSVPFDLSSSTGIEGFVRTADRKADLGVEKLSLVLNSVLTASVVQYRDLIAMADPDRIGAVGYSFGGAVVSEALKSDRRIRASINLDGWIFGKFAAEQIDKPYLMFGSTNSMPPVAIGSLRKNVFAMNELHLERIRGQIALPESRFVEIRGTLHGDFADGLHGNERWTQWRPWHPPLADPNSVREAIDMTVLSFLERHVKSASSAVRPDMTATERRIP